MGARGSVRWSVFHLKWGHHSLLYQGFKKCKPRLERLSVKVSGDHHWGGRPLCAHTPGLPGPGWRRAEAGGKAGAPSLFLCSQLTFLTRGRRVKKLRDSPEKVRSRGSQNSPFLSVSTKPVLVLLSQAEAWLSSLLLSCWLRVTNETWNPEKSTARQILHQRSGNSAKIKAKEQPRFSPVFFKCQGEK